ncbi:ficolin-1-like [Penaeus indicus]|uniref:ficolin-1-like n=1 Tax=Penaeus indicus TaxID=29960 RepID=UPI00300D2743
MDTDGGGWAVFQRRRDITPRLDFYRTWDEYARGFGDIAKGEFWLGNEHIHALTDQTTNELRVDLEDFAGATRFAKYSSFFVDDRDHFFTMTLSGYTGNAGDSFTYHNGQKFSAKDRDLDSGSGFCSSSLTGSFKGAELIQPSRSAIDILAPIVGKDLKNIRENGRYYSGWWFAACHRSSLNGEYLGGSHSLYARGIVWYNWHGHYYSLKSTTLMIRPAT